MIYKSKKALSASLVLTQNITDEDELELENIARSDALAAYRELVYSKDIAKKKLLEKYVIKARWLNIVS